MPLPYIARRAGKGAVLDVCVAGAVDAGRPAIQCGKLLYYAFDTRFGPST